MSIESYKRKDGLISRGYKFFFQGKVYRRGLGTVSLRYAKMAELQAKVLAAEGKHPPPKSQRQGTVTPPPLPTFDNFAPRFLAWYATDARPRSVDAYARRLELHLLPYLGDLRLSQASTAIIDDYRTYRRQEGASAGTVNGELTVLSALLRLAVDQGILEKAQRGTIRWLRVEERSIRILSAEEENRLLFAATPRLRPLISFALQTGLRRGELTGLTRADIDLARREVRVVAHRSKNRRERRVPLSREALAILDECEPRHGRLFGYRSISSVSANASRKAGLPGVSCHTLRHTWATRCLESGVAIHVVQKWLGHSDIKMTAKYLHVTSTYEREAIELIAEVEGKIHEQSPLQS